VHPKVPRRSVRDEVEAVPPVLHIRPALEACLFEPTFQRPEVRVGDVEASLSEVILNGVDEPVYIVIPPCVTQLDSIPPTKRGDIQWQARFRRHTSTSDENRNHEQVFLLQSLCDFRSDEIALLLESPATVLVNSAQPTRADQSEQYAALGDCLRNELIEVNAGPDVRKIPHYRRGAKTLLELGLERVRVARRILTSVAHKDPAHIAVRGDAPTTPQTQRDDQLRGA